MVALPPSFTSLYRLALRTSGAAVLNKNSATRQLRHLWRKPFEDAAHVIKQQKTTRSEQAKDMQVWLNAWERRVDNTLSLMYNSSQTRGLPHKLTKTLVDTMEYHIYNISSQRLPKWNPHLDMYTPVVEKRPTKREVELQQIAELTHSAFKAMGRVVRMAEGRDGVVLGTAKLRRKIT